MSLSEIYYKPENLWTGSQPVKRVKTWFALQAVANSPAQAQAHRIRAFSCYQGEQNSSS